MLAGHDTTADSLVWVFWELAKDCEFQARIRTEIQATRAKVVERGDTDFSIEDLEGLTLLQAALKVLLGFSSPIPQLTGGQEGLRLHPIVWQLTRTTERDDVIPLEFPITTKSGKSISAIPVSKGQDITVLISAYNRWVCMGYVRLFMSYASC
jgi:cytochrome P450